MRIIDADALTDKVVSHGEKIAYTISFLWDISDAPAIDAVPVVRCKDCIYYHEPHVRLDDGTEASYDSEIVREHIKKNKENGYLFPDYVSASLGINVGGMCEYEKDSGYMEDKSVFRNADDYCSRGKRGDTE